MARSARFVSESAVRPEQRLEKAASVSPWPQLYLAVCSVPSFVIERVFFSLLILSIMLATCEGACFSDPFKPQFINGIAVMQGCKTVINPETCKHEFYPLDDPSKRCDV
ncbi:small serum protein 2-like [Erythrolamprus reginae]|uniref:small serum protein 2-like n=1 Tax=Erythrolamprus reginae TaxID=121349 RepID=UPI00396CCF40